MKKFLAMVLILTMALTLIACGRTEEPAPVEKPAEEAEEVSTDGVQIELWTYPVGKWGDQATVEGLVAGFKEATGIDVKVEFLSYKDGDDKINTALTAKEAPDLVLEGPERLVANWGAKGYMVDLSDMLDDADKAEILPGPLAACTSTDGKLYEYPLVMTAHCMGVNLDAFKAAGADQYLNLETRTWTTEDYFKAIEALEAEFGGAVTAVFCGGQGGDQGTRALVNNLYGGTFANAEHTEYTWNDPANVKAIEALRDTEGVNFDAAIAGGDEIKLFYQGSLKIANCWNIQQQLDPNTAGTGAGKTVTGEEIVCMAFPTEDGTAPALQGGIWGFGIFDNGDQAKIDAAKQFIKYMADSEHTVEAVKASNFFPARTAAEGVDLSGVWADNEEMNEYQVLMPYLGDMYQVTKGWAQARTSWWTMLQEVGEGSDVAEAIEKNLAEANKAATA